jgi:hypothetical protein
MEGDAEDLQLVFPPAHAHAADEPAVGQRVDAGEELGHHDRMPVAEDEHGGAEARSLSDDGGGGENGHGLEIRLVRRVGETAAGIAGGHVAREDHVVAHPQ